MTTRKKTRELCALLEDLTKLGEIRWKRYGGWFYYQGIDEANKIAVFPSEYILNPARLYVKYDKIERTFSYPQKAIKSLLNMIIKNVENGDLVFSTNQEIINLTMNKITTGLF
jgi:hypothetical protein